jgi:hypothetical protein
MGNRRPCTLRRVFASRRERGGTSFRFFAGGSGYLAGMIALVAGLLVVWLVLAVLGLVIHGLFWLFVVGLILFLVTGGSGWLRRRSKH